MSKRIKMKDYYSKVLTVFITPEMMAFLDKNIKSRSDQIREMIIKEMELKK